MGIMGIYAYCKEHYPQSETIQYFGWIPLASIVGKVLNVPLSKSRFHQRMLILYKQLNESKN